MAYDIRWLSETDEEFARFATRFKRTIRDKIKYIAENWPESSKLRTVSQIAGQGNLGYSGNVFELRIGSGARLAFIVYEQEQLFIVYLLGTHDYCKSNYLKALQTRTDRPGQS